MYQQRNTITQILQRLQLKGPKHQVNNHEACLIRDSTEANPEHQPEDFDIQLPGPHRSATNGFSRMRIDFMSLTPRPEVISSLRKLRDHTSTIQRAIENNMWDRRFIREQLVARLEEIRRDEAGELQELHSRVQRVRASAVDLLRRAAQDRARQSQPAQSAPVPSQPDQEHGTREQRFVEMERSRHIWRRHGYLTDRRQRRRTRSDPTTGLERYHALGRRELQRRVGAGFDRAH